VLRSEIDKLTGENDELKKDLQLIENNNRARNDKLCENLSELGRRKRAYILVLVLVHLIVY
jgi:hypothetical protein